MGEIQPFTTKVGYTTRMYRCTHARKRSRTTLASRSLRAGSYWDAAEAFKRANEGTLKVGDRLTLAVIGSESKWYGDEEWTFRVTDYWGCLSLQHVSTFRYGRLTRHKT